MIEFLAQADCTTLHVEAAHRGPSTVFQVRLPSGEATPLRTLDVQLNAIGYARSQDLVYGLDDRGRLVALDRAGRVVGTPTRPSHLLGHATAGVVVGDRLVVRIATSLYSIDITPGSGRYGQVVREARLWPWEGLTVDDFDLNPADGLLYGVATYQQGGSTVVTIDPATGHVAKVPHAGRLPHSHGYGAVTYSPDGSLYATNNRQHGRSALWRVALDGSGVVTEITSRPSAGTVDSTGCLAALPVPPKPTPTPTPAPTTTTAPPVTTTVPTTTAPPPAAPPAVQRPAPTTTTTTSPATSPPRTPPPPDPPVKTADMRIPEQRAESEALERNNVRDQRRWGLAALVMILGAAAAARRAAAGRR